MKRSSDDRILTTITGSLPRPAELERLLSDRQNERPVDEAAFGTAVREAVAAAVARQAEVGIDVVSDGEQSKADYMDYIVPRSTGFGDVVDLTGSFGFSDMMETPELIVAVYGEAELKWRECVADLAYTDAGRTEVQRDTANFGAALDDVNVTEAFMPAVSPGLLAFTFPNRHYDSYEDYVFALADMLGNEYRAIVDAGYLVQIDAPDVAVLGHMTTWASAEVERLGKRGLMELHVAGINRALEGIDSENARLHLCYANYMGPHHHDMPIDEVLDVAFGANVCGINFEGANPAHAHEWQIFERLGVPDGKVIIPGVVDSKSQVVENSELVAQRIEQYVRLVGADKFMAGTDCGFGTGVGALQVHPKVGWMKLESLVEGARLASGRQSKAVA